MASTQDILDAAGKLGDMIASHAVAQKLESAIQALQADTDAQRAMNDLNRHIEKVAQKEATGKPIEVEDKRKLDSLQQAVVMNRVLRDFQMAQMDYVDLLRKVDEQITGVQEMPAPAPGTSPGPMSSSSLIH